MSSLREHDPTMPTAALTECTDTGRRLHERFGLDGAEVSQDVVDSPVSIGSEKARCPVLIMQGPS